MVRHILSGLALACLAGPGVLNAQTVQALVGGTLVDGTGTSPLEGAVVVVEGSRITCAGTPGDCPVPDGASVVDVTGRFVTPGLVDAHVHFSQTGWLDGRPDGLPAPEVFPYLETSRRNREDPRRWQRSYLCSGITAVFDVGGHPWTTDLPGTWENRADGVHIRAAGPLVTFARRTALQADDEMYTFLPMSSDAEALESVAKVAAMGSTALKVWYLRVAPGEREAMDRRLALIGDAAREAGLDLIVHATGLREAKAALRAGAAVLVHSVEDQLVDQEFLALAREAGTIYLPTLVVGENWSRAMISVVMDTPQELDDPNGCVDPETLANVRATGALRPYLPSGRGGDLEYALARMRGAGATQSVMAENLRRVHRAGITVATATDAGNPLTLHGPSIHNEMEAMQAAGLTPDEVVVMSTRNGALAMDRLDDIGTVEAGKIADLLVLTEDPTRDVRAFRALTHVMRAGVLAEQSSLAWRAVPAPDPDDAAAAERRRAFQEELRAPRPIDALESVWIEELTWMEVRDRISGGATTAIIATGGIEQNGPYLALGKHNYVLDGACEGIALSLGNALCAPIVKLVPEGDIDEPSGHMRYPGTLSVRQETFEMMLTDVARSLAAHGFTDVVLIGDSGGNQAGMRSVADALNARWSGTGTRAHYIPEFYEYAKAFEYMETELGIAEPTNDGLHDDFVISSIMLARDPETVRFPQRVRAGRATINGLSLEPLEEVQEIGRKILAFRVQHAVAAIRASLARPN